MKNKLWKRLRSLLYLGTLCLGLISMSCGSEEPEEIFKEPVVEEESGSETPEPEKPEVPETPEVPELPEPNNGNWVTADVALTEMGIGWNLGNTLDAWGNTGYDGSDWEYWETYWGQSVTTPDVMQMIRNAGFGAIRIPVTWGIHMDASGKVYDSWMNRVQQIVDYAMDAGLYCILNVHHDTGADEDVWLIASMKTYEAQKARYEGLWKQIAERFKDYGPRLLFESYNEMLDERRSWCFATFNGGYSEAEATDAYNAINSYAQSFVDVVRASGGNNTHRNLVVNTYGACSGAGNWNPHLTDPLEKMLLPKDVVENHLFFQIHTYPNIDNLTSAKNEVADMFSKLKTHLVSKGAPVIVGEWGNSSENPSTENKVAFIKDFVKQGKEAGMALYYWMGLTDGVARQIPAFSEPECAEAMLKAFHGESYKPVIPTMNSAEYTFTVSFEQQWSEANLCNKTINLNDYKGLRLELESKPKANALSIKIYGAKEGVEQYFNVTEATTEVTFDSNALGGKSTRITLQNAQGTPQKVNLKRVLLIRKDGTEEGQIPSAFWGCDVKIIK